MDWYTWLSKTNLDPTLVYEYGTTFARNELQEEDLAYFNHDFLQSIGIAVAKHRLEILKLAGKEAIRGRPSGFWKVASAMNKTKKLFTKNISKLVFHKNSGRVQVSEISEYRNQWSGALRKLDGVHKNQAMINSRSIVQSGPLDRNVQEKFMLTGRSISVSGPLDGKMQERLTYPNWSPMVTRNVEGRTKDRLGYFCKSPTISGAIDRWGLSPQVNYCRSEKVGEDDYGVQSLWSMMFQDMKPT